MSEMHPAPAPLVLADTLANHAWLDEIDDDSRQLLEWAADTIRSIVRMNLLLSQEKERLELDNWHLFQTLYGGQKGGAA